MVRDAPSRTEAQVYSVVEKFWMDNAVPPTVREIVRLARLTTTSMAHYYLRSLERLGYIEMRRGKPVPKWVIEKIGGKK
jgi:SOS-response transcriptional repressor LexA